MAEAIDSSPKAKRKVPAPRIIACQRCGVSVVSNSNNRRYCDDCRKIVDQESIIKATAVGMEKYWANKTEKIFQCEVCSCDFVGRKGQNKYCSPNCRRISTLARLKDARSESGAHVAGDPCVRCGTALDKSHGSALYCVECRKIVDREKGGRYAEKNREELRQRGREHNARRAKDPRYIKWQRNYLKEYTAKRRKDPRHKLDHRISQLVRNGLGGSKKGRTWESLVGYTIDDLIVHLERQFSPGMGWENIGDWHVDHILPRSMFKYETENCPDFKACWAITNLRPLWAAENIKKSDNRTLLI